MTADVLMLNTAVTDLRRPEFGFADELVGRGGLAKCKNEDMPNYSQQQLADHVDVTRQTIGLIEKGKYNPTLNLCLKIATALDKTLDQLFWEEK